MKKILQLSVLIFAVLLCFNNDAFAQRKKKKKKSETDEYFDESGGFAHRLWYGGNFTLGFSGGNISSVFQLGISPMVGYKLTDQLSVGPRISLLYTYYKTELAPNDIQSQDPLTYGIGAFARYKAFSNLFAHIEYEFENEANFVILNGDLEVLTREQNNFFLGAGYNSNSGGPWGYEILLLYNLLLPENTVEVPFSLRFGFTYNF